MRRLVLPILALTLVACGGAGADGADPSHPRVPATGIPGYPATRWVPAAPSYVLASPTVHDAQRAFRDALDAVGAPFGEGAREVGSELGNVLGVDPLRDEAVENIGVDVNGGFAIFSESIHPTIAVHLAQPDLLSEFLNAQRQRGMTTQSVIVDGIEVLTAKIGSDVHVSWAIVDDNSAPPFGGAARPGKAGAIDAWWLVHFRFDWLGDDGTTWLAHARAARGDWAARWDAAARLARGATAELAGFGDLATIVRALQNSVPAAVACAELVSPVAGVAISVDGDAQHASGKIALDIGSAAPRVRASLLAPPPGWGAATAGAPLAVQDNVDLGALTSWLMPCARSLDSNTDLAALGLYGVRAGRFALRAFDPDDTEHDAGVVALDLANAKTIAGYLDNIPLRRQLESDRQFGPYAGHSLGIPTVGRVDYVLTDKLAMAAMGDGLLASVATGAAAAGDPPLVAVDIAPPALSAKAWQALLELLHVGNGGAIADRLLRWKDGHIALSLDGTSLVLSASGNRR